MEKILRSASPLVAACFLFFTNAALAGTCDCKPEIINASAVVTSTCGKIWSNNHCTLKESGASASSSQAARQEAQAWEATVYQGLPTGGRVDPRNLSWPSSDWQDFYANIFPRLSDIGYLERLIVLTVQPEIPAEFAGAVLDLLRRNRDAVVRAWSKGDVHTFTGREISVKISGFCIYAEGPNRNFYINAKPEGRCGAARQ